VVIEKVINMENQDINRQIVAFLNEWDPFGLGEGNYDTEIADVMQALHYFDNRSLLAKDIRRIYEFSFEEFIPMEKCLEVADHLLLLKNSSTCSL
jgi:hypothetical protein